MKNKFLQDFVLDIDIPKEISENFLKIVTNIFYLNLYRTWKEYKSLYLFTDAKDIPEGIVDKIYQKHLKLTRREIYEFFKIKKTNFNLIGAKTLVRLYPFTLPYKHEIKTKYLKLSDEIDILIDNMSKRIIPEVLLAENDESDLFVIKDVYSNFNNSANMNSDLFYKILWIILLSFEIKLFKLYKNINLTKWRG